MGVAVAGVGDDRDLDVVRLAAIAAIAGEQVGQQRHRRADVLEQQRAARLERREGGPPGRDEQLALVRVVGGEAPRSRRPPCRRPA